MNAVTAVTKPSKLDNIRAEILPPDRKQEFFAGLPAHVKPDRFMRNLDNALMSNPDLMECDPRLIFREVSKAAALGLYLDPQLGEAYLIAAWNGKKKRKEPQLRIGYRGLIKLGRQSGEISQIYAHEVHANDVFKAVLGDDKKLIHEPDVFGDRGPVVGYYAVVKYKDGDSDFEPLTIAQAHAIRDRSDGWKAFKADKIKSTPWSTDEVEMAKKTAIRRLTKRIPQSPELAEALQIEDAAEHSDGGPAPAPQPPRPPMPPQPPMHQISASSEDITDVDYSADEEGDEDGSEAAETSSEAVDEQTGEVTDGDVDDTTDFFNHLDQEMAKATDDAGIEEVWVETDPLARFENKPNGEINQKIAVQIKNRHLKRIASNG